MTEAGSMFGAEHVRRYRETNGEVGHICGGATDLLLTTKGGSSGGPRTTPVAYDRVGDDFLVLASNGGGAHPGWYRSLARAGRRARGGQRLPRACSDRTGPERPRPWALGAGQHADWARCQAMTDREIPVVALERKRADGHETTIRGGTQ